MSCKPQREMEVGVAAEEHTTLASNQPLGLVIQACEPSDMGVHQSPQTAKTDCISCRCTSRERGTKDRALLFAVAVSLAPVLTCGRAYPPGPLGGS